MNIELPQSAALSQTDQVNDNMINIQFNDEQESQGTNSAGGHADDAGAAAAGSSKIVLDTIGFPAFDQVQGESMQIGQMTGNGNHDGDQDMESDGRSQDQDMMPVADQDHEHPRVQGETGSGGDLEGANQVQEGDLSQDGSQREHHLDEDHQYIINASTGGLNQVDLQLNPGGNQLVDPVHQEEEEQDAADCSPAGDDDGLNQ